MAIGLSREEIDAIRDHLFSFDQEPLSEDVLVRAVEYLAGRCNIDIRREYLNKVLRFRRPMGNRTTVRVVDGSRYHCGNYNVMQGDTSEFSATKTSELAWTLCGKPNLHAPKA